MIEPKPHKRVAMKLDFGVRKTVELLREAGIETFESCEGSAGHCFHEPTIRFHGHLEAGWRALGLCLTWGLPVANLRRYWSVEDGEPHGPHWEIVFSQRPG